ncbi:hypothetical protein COB57_00195 [Candidatus Peregrinibacteria bacterium]|nr:MAG: hypothetical protein COB57_00195 [Candidatus Peregrinibacteria bacterium]
MSLSFFLKKEMLLLKLFLLLLFPFVLEYFELINIFQFEQMELLIFLSLISLVPALIWIAIFNAEHHEKKSVLVSAFLAGCFSTVPIFFYQHLFVSGEGINLIFFKASAVNFQNNIAETLGYASSGELQGMANNVPLTLEIIGSLFAVFLGVGVLEEVFKQVVVNTDSAKYFTFLAVFLGVFSIASDHSIGNIAMVLVGLLAYFVFLREVLKNLAFKSIDDAIEIAIIAALGFAFVENIHYFITKFGSNGFGVFIVIRVVFVTFIHILCSGIFGYHVGMAHFASDVLQDDYHAQKKHWFLRLVHKFFDIPKSRLFYYEHIILGLFLSVVFHALFDFFMAFQSVALFGIPLFAIVIPAYFIFGGQYLYGLFEKKEDQKEFIHTADTLPK